MGRTVVLIAIIFFVISGNTYAQYHVSSNEKLFLANAPKAEQIESAETTAQNFFKLAQKGIRGEWEQLLASNCFKENVPCDYVNLWFDYLSYHKMSYSIVKISSPKTNQKIIQYVSSLEPDEKKRMVLIKEKGEWRIYHAGL